MSYQGSVSTEAPGEGERQGPVLKGALASVAWALMAAIASPQGNRAWAQPAAATSPTAAQQRVEQLLEVPSPYSLGLDYEQDQAQDWPVVTETDTSLFRPTLPSLWWNRDQMVEAWGGYRLLRGWTAFHSRSSDAYIIDVQVEPQYWNLLTPAQRYAVLMQLGLTGMSYGYQVRLYNAVTLVGVHACDFSRVPELAAQPGAAVPIPALQAVSCYGGLSPLLEFVERPSEIDLFNPP